MKALVFDAHFTTKYVNLTYSNETLVTYIAGLEMKLLSIVLQQMNLPCIYITSRENFERENWLNNSDKYLFLNEYYTGIVVGEVGIFFPHRFLPHHNTPIVLTVF